MSTITQILCPVDFSEFSRKALDYALGVARCCGSTVTALHVVAPVPLPVPYALGMETAPPMTLPPVDLIRVEAELAGFAATEQAGALRATTVVTEAPVIHREILVQAKRLHADLIVLGTHGRSASNGCSSAPRLKRCCGPRTVP